jgi:REP element-mobilizing transposase RayT
MSRYRRAPIPGATYFFTLNTYRRQALLTHAEVLTALHSAHRVVRATHPFRVEALVILPNHLHAVWSLPPEDTDYSTRLSLLKRHVSQMVRHLLSASQSASRHKRWELALWQRRFWEHQSVMTPIMSGTWITFITIRSSMGLSPKSVIGHIRRFIVTSDSVCIQMTGRVPLCHESKVVMANLPNSPRAHSSPYACWSSDPANGEGKVGRPRAQPEQRCGQLDLL